MKGLKILILFIAFVSGCSRRYVDVEGKSLDEKVVDSWEELDADIIRIYEGKVRLSIRVKDFDVVSGWVKSREFYKRSSREKEDILIPLGMLIGLGGCYYGFDYGCIQNDFMHPDHEREDRGCLISLASCATGLVVMSVGAANRRKAVKPVFRFIKTDTVCVDNELLSKRKVKISIVDLDFEKSYYTDEKGNIELQFDEIIPEHTKADSVLSIIIRHYELVDTVNVKIR